MQNKNRTTSPFGPFEAITRNLRWASIALVLVTFPPNAAQANNVYWVLLVASLYNWLRYFPGFYNFRLLSSPALMLVIDNMFVGMLLWLVGSITTPYSALLVFMVINGAYLYQLSGVLGVALLQTTMLLLVAGNEFLDPVRLNDGRLLVITVCSLLLMGYLVIGLTRGDREERESLANLKRKSERERLRLHALVDSLNLAIFMTDDAGKVVDYNEAARVLTGRKENLNGEQLSKLLPLYPRMSSSDKRVNILRESASAQHRRDLSLRTASDRLIDLDISVIPVESEKGKIGEYIVLCEDITTERSLDDQRAQFISVASHELRTPLAIIEAALGTVADSKDLPESTLKLIEQAHRNSTLLSGIVRDITTLAEAQNDNLPIQLTHINAKELLQDLKRDFDAQAKERGLEIRVVVDEKTPDVLSTRRYIEEILENYITNALKYSDKGTVTIKADPGNNDGALFSVHDEGIGISAKDQKMLFTKFFRAEDYRTRSTNGTGLGLYLCMEIAQRMNAKVWCDSSLNKGSIFYLEVPPFSNLKRDQGEIVEAQLSGIVDEL